MLRDTIQLAQTETDEKIFTSHVSPCLYCCFAYIRVHLSGIHFVLLAYRLPRAHYYSGSVAQ